MHHAEGSNEDDGLDAVLTCCEERRRVVESGKSTSGFEHLPLVLRLSRYGYGATAGDEGALILLIDRHSYMCSLRSSVAQEMESAVSSLSATKFFAAWTQRALQRLYFWFERTKVPAGQEVVRQGDAADFCFIILSGSCDVLVNVPTLSPPRMLNASPPLHRPPPTPPTPSSGPNSTTRHVATLGCGALVGEIALLRDGELRMASVRTASPSILLMLSKAALPAYTPSDPSLLVPYAAHSLGALSALSWRSLSCAGCLSNSRPKYPRAHRSDRQVQRGVYTGAITEDDKRCQAACPSHRCPLERSPLEAFRRRLS